MSKANDPSTWAPLVRRTVHGLPISVENRAGTYREGTDPNGKKWRQKMVADYGFFDGTRGADGEGVDVFIGPHPADTSVFIVNQNVPGTGRFDEIKVMVGFPTRAAAMHAYLKSYSSDWKGFRSIVSATVYQLKRWLKEGPHMRAVTPADLPHDPYADSNSMDTAADTTTRIPKLHWNADAQPIEMSLNQALYRLRQCDTDDGLLLDSLTLDELYEDPDHEAIVTLDALVVEVGRMKSKMDALMRVMAVAGDEATKPYEVSIGDPVKSRGVLQVPVVFTLTDGQTVTAWFHNPDATPAKLTPMDELVSWRWLLNKRDVTIMVAPERGQDLDPREVGRRVMQLAKKNSAAFAAANAKVAERAGQIDALKTEIVALEEESLDLDRKIGVAEEAAAAAKLKAEKAVTATDEHGDRWARMTTTERHAVLARAGYAVEGRLTLSGQGLINRAWEAIGQSARKSLAKAMDALAGQVDPAPVDPVTPEPEKIDPPKAVEIPEAVKANVRVILMPGRKLAEGLQSARETDAKFNGGGRYAAEFWRDKNGAETMANEAGRLLKLLERIPGAAERAALEAYIGENRNRVELTEQEAGYFAAPKPAAEPAMSVAEEVDALLNEFDGGPFAKISAEKAAAFPDAAKGEFRQIFVIMQQAAVAGSARKLAEAAVGYVRESDWQHAALHVYAWARATLAAMRDQAEFNRKAPEPTRDYATWEAEVIRLLEAKDITTSDAQGIIEARADDVRRAFEADQPPDLVALTLAPPPAERFVRKWPMTVEQAQATGLISSKWSKSAGRVQWYAEDAQATPFGTAGEALEHYYTVVEPARKAQEARDDEEGFAAAVRDAIAGKVIAVAKSADGMFYLVHPKTGEIESGDGPKMRRRWLSAEDEFGIEVMQVGSFQNIDKVADAIKSKAEPAVAADDEPIEVTWTKSDGRWRGESKYGEAVIQKRGNQWVDLDKGIAYPTAKAAQDAAMEFFKQTRRTLAEEAASRATSTKTEPDPVATRENTFVDMSPEAFEAIDGNSRVEVQARAIEAAVRSQGGDISWEVTDRLPSEYVTYDSVGEAILDGDFKGHPFRGNQYKTQAHASSSAGQFSREARRAESSSKNDGVLHHAHDAAHRAHKNAARTAGGKAKVYHETMAKFHEKRANWHKARDGKAMDSAESPDAWPPVLDDAALFDLDGEKYLLGRISYGSRDMGTVTIRGDGAAHFNKPDGSPYIGGVAAEDESDDAYQEAADDDLAGWVRNGQKVITEFLIGQIEIDLMEDDDRFRSGNASREYDRMAGQRGGDDPLLVPGLLRHADPFWRTRLSELAGGDATQPFEIAVVLRRGGGRLLALARRFSDGYRVDLLTDDARRARKHRSVFSDIDPGDRVGALASMLLLDLNADKPTYRAAPPGYQADGHEFDGDTPTELLEPAAAFDPAEFDAEVKALGWARSPDEAAWSRGRNTIKLKQAIGSLVVDIEDVAGPFDAVPATGPARLVAAEVERRVLARLAARPAEPTPQDRAMARLREIVAGTLDSNTLGWMLDEIDAAMADLGGEGMAEDAADLANQAITHWAELESKAAQ